MSPILKEIKEVFDKYKSSEIGQMNISICNKAPFHKGNYWMYYYLFPEILIDGHDEPCYYFTEEQVLRIMAEHDLL